MKNRIVLLLLAFCLFSCKNKKEDHIPLKVMSHLLIDMHMAEVYSTLCVKDTLHTVHAKNMDSLTAYYKDIFARYKVTQDQFNNSMNWYKSHPEDIDSVYAVMIPVLTRMDASTQVKK